MIRFSTLLLALFAAVAVRAAAPAPIDLAGQWQIAIGEGSPYSATVNLPGSMLTNGLGNDVDTRTQWTGSIYDMSYYHRPDMAKYREPGNIKFPFFLTPDKEYVGTARYRREVSVPASWKGHRVLLSMERPHIESTLYVNSREVGHQMSLSTPHVYDVTDFITPGADNTIEVKIYNGIENVCVGQDSHSVTDQTQGNWNGIAGRISLTPLAKGANIASVRVYPDLDRGEAVVKAVISEARKGLKVKAVATLDGDSKAKAITASKAVWNGDTATLVLPMAKHGFKTWDEFSPSVYRLTLTAGSDSRSTVFGMRKLEADGLNMKINGKPVIMRGTVENCNFPLTGYAPHDEAEWERIFRKCREYGLNMMRFHSYCPPEAAFAAADRVGIYLQPEGPSWPNHGVKLGQGMSIDKYLVDEGKRIIDTYGNHPSFVMMAAGNEPAGAWPRYVKGWVAQMKAYDPSRLYCGASVGGGWAWDEGSEYHVKGGARGLNWDKRLPATTDDYASDLRLPRNFKPTPEHPFNTEPYISHEKGQWCAFPDFNEISQYTGPYKAKNFEIFRDLLAANGMEGLGDKFNMASGRLQELCYKYEIERNLRTPDYAGFQLLGLNDYSGQGTALVGVLNVFWREKPYTDTRAWRQSCGPVVILGRLPKFVYTSADTLNIPFEAVNVSGTPIPGQALNFTLATADSVAILAHGTLPATDLAMGKNLPLGDISLPLGDLSLRHRTDGTNGPKYRPVPLRALSTPLHLRLSLELPGVATNSYDLWVYPEKLPEPDFAGIHVTDTLDSRALDVLRAGGKVLMAAAGKVSLGRDVKQTYLPVFWNTSWFKMRPPHTTGASIDDTHPLFANGFPTDNWGNLNWWELLNGSQVMNLHELPASYQSPIQPIDTWHQSRKLGMLVEANVLGGKLLLTTLPLPLAITHPVIASGNNAVKAVQKGKTKGKKSLAVTQNNAEKTDAQSIADTQYSYTPRADRPVARQMLHAIAAYMQTPEFAPTLTLTPEQVSHFFTTETEPIATYTTASPDELKPAIK